ncbi:hypothetical protein ENSA5_15250 [Enhygromyxa salina]|uniref:Uncharacterized protein n=1 Tax=Enhygromyxa salina TaxID=215803 RepID=A0A2S9YEG8_9BACT|nr:hypothetical protein ENSA5_15250 [Enhygromyxa salina]
MGQIWLSEDSTTHHWTSLGTCHCDWKQVFHTCHRRPDRSYRNGCGVGAFLPQS